MNHPNFRIGMTSVEAIVEIIRINLKRERSGFKGNFIWFYAYKPKENVRDKKVNSLSRLLFHDFSRSGLVGIKSEYITADRLNYWIRLLDKGEGLGVISDIKIARSFEEHYSAHFHHIPMMDFRCPKSPGNLARVKRLLKVIGEEEGVILDSGRSYHYFGVNPLTEKDRLMFLGKCLLSELVDQRYVGHRLLDGCSILRISASPKRRKTPTVVAILQRC